MLHGLALGLQAGCAKRVPHQLIVDHDVRSHECVSLCIIIHISDPNREWIENDPSPNKRPTIKRALSIADELKIEGPFWSPRLQNNQAIVRAKYLGNTDRVASKHTARNFRRIITRTGNDHSADREEVIGFELRVIGNDLLV